MLALQMGATFVARGFSGDKEQLVPLIAAAVAAQGRRVHRRRVACALRSTIIPGSTKSYDYAREHGTTPSIVASIAMAVRVRRSPRTARQQRRCARCRAVRPVAGCRLHRLDTTIAIRSDKVAAECAFITEPDRAQGGVVTGLLYVRPDAPTCTNALLGRRCPLTRSSDAELIPGR